MEKRDGREPGIDKLFDLHLRVEPLNSVINLKFVGAFSRQFIVTLVTDGRSCSWSEFHGLRCKIDYSCNTVSITFSFSNLI